MKAFVRWFLSLFGYEEWLVSTAKPKISPGEIFLDNSTDVDACFVTGCVVREPEIACGQARVFNSMRRAWYRSKRGQVLTAKVVRVTKGGIVFLRRGNAGSFRRFIST